MGENEKGDQEHGFFKDVGKEMNFLSDCDLKRTLMEREALLT